MITQIPFEEEDHIRAHNLINNELGMEGKYTYTSMSDMGPCYTLCPTTRFDRRGEIINTKEFGLLLVQTEETLLK